MNTTKAKVINPKLIERYPHEIGNGIYVNNLYNMKC